MTGRTMLKYFFSALVFVVFLVTNTIYAHGVHEARVGTSYVEPPSSFWSFFIADVNAASKVRIKKKGDYRYIESDGLPDHSTGRFPNANNPNKISEQKHKFRMTSKPSKRRSPTFIGHSAFGVAINGIPFDPATAEYWNNVRSSPWNIDAINGGVNLGLDHNNGHVQPNGAYHYHSIPMGLMERFDQYSKPVLLGYAADGFAIYGPYAYEDANDMSSELINMFPSYRLKEGERSGGPGGKYDGTYTADYVYVKGLGDLDQCNGREGVTEEYPGGTYYYVITDTYPFIPRCWMGKADDSFRKEPRKKTKIEKPPVQEEENEEAKPEKERRPKIDTRGRGIPARDPRVACSGRRSGSFCSYRGRDLRTVHGTCRSAGSYLICTEIGR